MRISADTILRLSVKNERFRNRRSPPQWAPYARLTPQFTTRPGSASRRQHGHAVSQPTPNRHRDECWNGRRHLGRRPGFDPSRCCTNGRSGDRAMGKADHGTVQASVSRILLPVEKDRSLVKSGVAPSAPGPPSLRQARGIAVARVPGSSTPTDPFGLYRLPQPWLPSRRFRFRPAAINWA